MARANCGLRQDHFAEKIECSAAHVSLMESGKRRPSTKILERVAMVAGVTIEQLVSWAA